MAERKDGGHLPEFPKDVSAQNCAYAPVEIEGILPASFLPRTSIEPNQLVARCENPLDNEVSRLAVVTVTRNASTGKIIAATPVVLERTTDGTAEATLPGEQSEVRVLVERKY